MMDAFELLKNDHKKVSQLFEEIESASGQTKTQLFSSLKKELDLHAHVEETVFYPALENTEAARAITLEAYEEHKVVKDLLSELGSGGAPNDEWDAKFTVLKENVEHHVEEEEGELFSKARQALTKEQIERFGVEMEAEKSRKQGGAPRPSTPEAAGRDSQSASQKNESPGVLQRIASLVGLGDKSASGSKNVGKKRGTATTKRATPKKASAKRSSSKQATKSAAKKSGTKKLGASTTKKSTAKKSTAKKSAIKESVGKTRSAGTAKRASKAGRSKSTKRQVSVGARSSARKAPRPAATKKAGRGATKRRRAK